MGRNGLTAGNAPSMSQRQIEDFNRIAAEEEKLVRLDPKRSTRGMPQPSHIGSVRERIEREEAEAREKAEATAKREFSAYGHPQIPGVPQFATTEEASDWFLAQHKAEEAQAAQAILDEQNRNAEIARKNAAQQKENLKLFNIKLALDQVNATEAERKRIWGLIANRPEVDGARVTQMVYTLRDETGPKPDWRF